VIVKVEDAAVVGVPEMMPVPDTSVRPAGSAPEVTAREDAGSTWIKTQSLTV
jgi:hypothetical protein